MLNRKTTREQELGKLLQELREDAKVKQEVVGRLTRLGGPTSVSKVETGHRRIKLDEYLAYCEAINQDAPTVLKEVVQIFKKHPSGLLKEAKPRGKHKPKKVE